MNRTDDRMTDVRPATGVADWRFVAGAVLAVAVAIGLWNVVSFPSVTGKLEAQDTSVADAKADSAKLARGNGESVAVPLPWNYRPYQVKVWLVNDAQPRWTMAIMDRIGREVLQQLRMFEPTAWRVQWEVVPEHWRESLSRPELKLAELPAELYEELTSNGSVDKLVIIRLQDLVASIDFQVNELDVNGWSLGPAYERSVADIDQLPLDMADTVRQAFRPIVMINHQDGDRVVAKVRAYGLMFRVEPVDRAVGQSVDPIDGDVEYELRPDRHSPCWIESGEIFEPVLREANRQRKFELEEVELLDFTLLVQQAKVAKLWVVSSSPTSWQGSDLERLKSSLLENLSAGQGDAWRIDFSRGPENYQTALLEAVGGQAELPEDLYSSLGRSEKLLVVRLDEQGSGFKFQVADFNVSGRLWVESSEGQAESAGELPNALSAAVDRLLSRDQFVVSRIVSVTRSETALGRRRGRNTERIGIVVRTPPQPTKIRLFTMRGASRADMQEFPLNGYQIYSRSIYGTEDSFEYLGKTDWNGTIEIEPGAERVRLLLVKNGERNLARLPVMPGYKPFMQRLLPDDDARIFAEGVVSGLKSEVLDLWARRKVMMERIKISLEKNEFAAAERYFRLYRELMSLNQWYDYLTSQERRLATNERRQQDKITAMFTELKEFGSKEFNLEDDNKVQNMMLEARQQRTGGRE